MKSVRRVVIVPAAALLVAGSIGCAAETSTQFAAAPAPPLPGPGPQEERQFVPEAWERTPAGSAAVLATRSIYFDSGRSDLREATLAALADVAALLKANPTAVVRLEGHTDAVGGDLYNLQLGQARAYAVAQHLIREDGIEAGRVQATVFGKASPVADNGTEGGRALNRRVTLTIVLMRSPVAALR